jgi:hypothetical protein
MHLPSRRLGIERSGTGDAALSCWPGHRASRRLSLADAFHVGTRRRECRCGRAAAPAFQIKFAHNMAISPKRAGTKPNTINGGHAIGI